MTVLQGRLVILALAAESLLVAQGTPGPGPTESTSADRPVSWKLLPSSFLGDQKRIWLFPTRVARGRNLVPALGVVAVTAGLVALDPKMTQAVRRTTAFNGFNRWNGGTWTGTGTAVFPLAVYGVGWLRSDKYAKETAFLAMQSLADTEIVSIALQTTLRRRHPSDIAPNGNFADSWFDNTGGGFRRGSFPSGHTISAFGVATVISRRYPSHKWVPFVAYGLAGAIGFSRISRSAHFPSDVFAGAALGYSISRFAVLRP